MQKRNILFNTLISICAITFLTAGSAAGYDRGLLEYSGGRGFFMGGTNIIPYRAEWGDALDGPDIGIEGFYFKLMFGGGGGKKK